MKIEIDVAEFATQLKAGKGIGGNCILHHKQRNNTISIQTPIGIPTQERWERGYILPLTAKV